MKSTELRIGNIIEDYDEKQIKVLPNDILALYQTEIVGGDNVIYFAIELNEQWLTKLGFIKDDDADGDEYWGNNGIHIYWYEFASNTFNGFYFRREIGDELRIKYVHELQNLYYAYNAEELECEGF